MAQAPPKERAPLPAKSRRKAKEAAPVVVTYKSMAKCMAAALLNCQRFKQAKAAKGQRKKRVKLTPEEKLRRLILRQAAAMAKRAAKVRAYEDARDARRAAKEPIKTQVSIERIKGFGQRMQEQTGKRNGMLIQQTELQESKKESTHIINQKM
jgi:hypothetical protein